jgi:hypothetical protein
MLLKIKTSSYTQNHHYKYKLSLFYLNVYVHQLETERSRLDALNYLSSKYAKIKQSDAFITNKVNSLMVVT